MQGVLKRLKFWHLAHFSKPAADHPLYQAIRQREVRSILEIGIGNGQRTQRMIELASQATPVEQLNYVGIDLFEMRSGGMTLKAAHRAMKALGARTRLIPGDPHSALARTANELSGIELVVIGLDVDAHSLERAWFFLPRTLAVDCIAFRAVASKDADGYRLEALTPADIERLAVKSPRRRAA